MWSQWERNVRHQYPTKSGTHRLPSNQPAQCLCQFTTHRKFWTKDLNTRVILKELDTPIPQILRITEPLIPRLTPLLQGRKPLRRHQFLQIFLPLQDLHR